MIRRLDELVERITDNIPAEEADKLRFELRPGRRDLSRVSWAFQDAVRDHQHLGAIWRAARSAERRSREIEAWYTVKMVASDDPVACATIAAMSYARDAAWRAAQAATPQNPGLSAAWEAAWTSAWQTAWLTLAEILIACLRETAA